MTLDGRTALVTGGGRGIGQAICLSLAGRGANVVVADLDEAEMADTASQIEAMDSTTDGDGAGEDVLTVRTDVTDPADVEGVVEATIDQFGSIEILVNNAGIAGPTKPCEAVAIEEWDETLAVNLRGPFLVCRAVLPHMKAQEYGRIVNVASMSGKRPLLNRTPYVASKMGLIGLTRTLALEGGPHDVNVNAVCPGPVEGPRLSDVIREQAQATGRSVEEERAVSFEGPTARGELVQREDVAELVAFLSSDAATRITGQDVNVSSGMVMY